MSNVLSNHNIQHYSNLLKRGQLECNDLCSVTKKKIKKNLKTEAAQCVIFPNICYFRPE